MSKELFTLTGGVLRYASASIIVDAPLSSTSLVLDAWLYADRDLTDRPLESWGSDGVR
jgi:hypothetical protein